ncbi:SKP1-like protein 21 [Tanacetum coccineum]
MDTNRLCELTSADDSLQLKPLVDLTSRVLARMIEGKTPKEIHVTFHIPDDFTEVFCAFILNARKRKELKEKEKLKVILLSPAFYICPSIYDLHDRRLRPICCEQRWKF